MKVQWFGFYLLIDRRYENGVKSASFHCQYQYILQ